MSDRMTRPAHTALPWHRPLPDDTTVLGADGSLVASMGGNYHGDGWATMEANAALIVRAVNAHDELVEALEAILAKHKGLFGDPPHELAGCDLQDIERAYAALARAKEPRP